MSKHRLIALLSVVVLAALMAGSAQAAPPAAGPKGQVTGVLTGKFDILQPDMSYVHGDFQYHFAIQAVPGGGAKGWASWKAREGPGADWKTLKVAVDCVEFLTVDGKPAAIYSGTIVKAEWPDYYRAICGEYLGQLKIGMVIDGGTGAAGDQAIFWVPPPYVGFFPNQGTPLNCVVPAGSADVHFQVTGGDVVVKAN
ncbi:MAG: hypothetical protein GX557_10605 [Chloroflexi bacterium]|nr:hypothetical protein [Chloroflexota bacterium]